MKVVKIHAQVGVTVNLGNYESLRVDFGAEAEVEHGEDVSLATRQLYAAVRKHVGNQVGQIVSADRRVYDDLPVTIREIVTKGGG